MTRISLFRRIATYWVTDPVSYKYGDQEVVVDTFEVAEAAEHSGVFDITITTECGRTLTYYSAGRSRWPGAVQRLYNDHVEACDKRA